jgi:hypothetical protein
LVVFGLFWLFVFASHKEKKRSEKGEKRGEKEERFFAAAEKKNEKNSNQKRTALRSSFLFHITHLSLLYTLLQPFV